MSGRGRLGVSSCDNASNVMAGASGSVASRRVTFSRGRRGFDVTSSPVRSRQESLVGSSMFQSSRGRRAFACLVPSVLVPSRQGRQRGSGFVWSSRLQSGLGRHVVPCRVPSWCVGHRRVTSRQACSVPMSLVGARRVGSRQARSVGSRPVKDVQSGQAS